MMIRTFLFIATALLLASCEKPSLSDFLNAEQSESYDEYGKKFTFTVKGDFTTPTFTRGYLSADGKDMTDLWVFDYVEDECVQMVHQTAADDNWGKPSMVLSYGSHHIYFVASRGEGATLDADSHVIEWELPRDTYWKDYAVDVVSTSNGNRAVTLDRVATKLKITVNDEVPATCASISFTPSQWFYGWDYVAGTPALSRNTERVVTVPASYVGTAGQLTASIFGLSSSSEWTTDVVLSSKDASNQVIGSVTIIGAPFISNRSTEYSGNLFGSSNGIDVTLSTDWLSPVVATW